MHDGWKSYQRYTGCRHALCNVHHLRELTFLEEQEQKTWATEMKALLQAMKAATDDARAHGASQVAAGQHTALVARYEALLVQGVTANPLPPPHGQRPRGRRKQSPARNLLERLWLGQD